MSMKDPTQGPATAGLPVHFEERGNFKLNLLKNPNFSARFPAWGTSSNRFSSTLLSNR